MVSKGCVRVCVHASPEYTYLWDGVPVFELLYVSLNVSLCILVFLWTFYTVSSLTAPPAANERISIWQK